LTIIFPCHLLNLLFTMQPWTGVHGKYTEFQPSAGRTKSEILKCCMQDLATTYCKEKTSPSIIQTGVTDQTTWLLHWATQQSIHQTNYPCMQSSLHYSQQAPP
jgi:hypothetical protein